MLRGSPMAWSRDKWLSVTASAAIRMGDFIGSLIPTPWVAAKTDPLLEAVKRCNTLLVQSLLSQGADPNARETQAVFHQWLRTVVVDIPEGSGKTALMLAADAGNRGMVELLLDCGAEVNARDV